MSAASSGFDDSFASLVFKDSRDSRVQGQARVQGSCLFLALENAGFGLERVKTSASGNA